MLTFSSSATVQDEGTERAKTVLAHHFNNRLVLRRAFRAWASYPEMVLAPKRQFHQELHNLHIRNVARTALRFWRLWVDVRADVAREKDEATERHVRSVLRRGMRQWKLALKRSWWNKRACKKADKLRKFHIIRRWKSMIQVVFFCAFFFISLSLSLCVCSVSSLLSQQQDAPLHFVFLHPSFPQERKRDRLLVRRATNFFQFRQLRKTFKGWMEVSFLFLFLFLFFFLALALALVALLLFLFFFLLLSSLSLSLCGTHGRHSQTRTR